MSAPLPRLVMRPMQAMPVKITRIATTAPPLTQHAPSVMGIIKLMIATQMLASAIITDNDALEWKVFGSLLVGGVLSGAFGMAVYAMRALRKNMDWRWFATRFLANLVGSLGIGALAIWAIWHYAEINPGPLICIGVAFLCGVTAVTIWSVVDSRLEARVGDAVDQVFDALNFDRKTPKPPVVAKFPPKSEQ